MRFYLVALVAILALPGMPAASPSTQAISPRPTAFDCAANKPCVYLPLVVRPTSVVFVVPGGAGAHTGADWANAQDLQAALTDAAPGTQLWVKAGTYTPTSGTDRTMSFALKSGVAVYGGFAGNETALDQRNSVVNLTTLSGEIGAAGADDNTFHVVTGIGTDATAILDGVTITAGKASLCCFISNGGGIYNNHGSSVLTNVTLPGDVARDSGGGMYNQGSSPVLTNVTFSGNSADNYGGGMYNEESSPTLTNVTISGNHAGDYGGGIANASQSSPVLTNVTLSGNSAGNEGGGISNVSSNPVLTNVILSGNNAQYGGGGMYSERSNAVLNNVTISGNHAVVGGGIWNLFTSSMIVRNSILWGNSTGAILDSIGTTADVQSSDVEGGYAGTGNTSADPGFVNPIAATSAATTTGDLRLGAGSPAINAGNNTFLPTSLTTDRDGFPRIIALTVDLGAYERQTTQAIRFAPIPDKTFGAPPFTVTASASSGLPVTFSASGNCTVVGTLITLTAPGPCAITASVAATATYDLGTLTRIFAITVCPLAGRLYVNPEATGRATGERWTDAIPRLEVALTASAGCSHPLEIWLARGSYTPTNVPDRNATFQLRNTVAIYGGFAGSETERSQRDSAANMTILSGDIGVQGDTSDNTFHVVTGSGTDATAILDGVTVTGGNANLCCSIYNGGGIYNNQGSPVLTNVNFSGNHADFNGGGMYNQGSSPTLTNVTLSGNSADNYGGGMYNDESSPVLTNVTLSGNHAEWDGGGMLNWSSSPVLTNVTISGNHARGGGGMSNYSSDAVLTNVILSGNTAEYGGGMDNHESSPVLTNVTLSGNIASISGGGMSSSSSDAVLTNVTFSGNHAEWDGGGMFNGISGPVLTNVTLSGNHTGHFGGGMANFSCSPVLTNVTLSDNRAGYSGGGMYNYNGSPVVRNSIVWGNGGGTIGGDRADVQSSDVEHGYAGPGNLRVDPLFVNPIAATNAPTTTGDYRLRAGSPAINAGNNTFVPPGVATDLDGHPRIVGGTVDMGAYEADESHLSKLSVKQ